MGACTGTSKPKDTPVPSGNVGASNQNVSQYNSKPMQNKQLGTDYTKPVQNDAGRTSYLVPVTGSGQNKYSGIKYQEKKQPISGRFSGPQNTINQNVNDQYNNIQSSVNNTIKDSYNKFQNNAQSKLTQNINRVNEFQSNVRDSSNNIQNNIANHSKDLFNTDTYERLNPISKVPPAFSNITNNLTPNPILNSLTGSALKPNYDWARDISQENFQSELEMVIIPSIDLKIS